jgi:hypothetical protein
MSKGGGSTRQVQGTSVEPPAFQKPFIEYGLSQAKQLYESEKPQYYPGQTVVGYSPESEMALQGIREQAISGSPFIQGVQDVVMQNLMGTNPLQSAAFRPVVEQVQAQAAQSGRYGSGYQQAALAQALAPMALQAQQQAIAQAPAARQFGYADLETLAGVGAAREAQQQAELAADIERFQFEQARPQQKLAQYLAAVTGGEMGETTYEAQQRQPLTSILGGAMSGAQLGGMVPGLSTGAGAGLGALAGLLG